MGLVEEGGFEERDWRMFNCCLWWGIKDECNEGIYWKIGCVFDL